jgi:hypothetical protein
MIRVTKGVGKKLKIRVESEISFKVTDVNLTLLDNQEPNRQGRLTDGKERASRFSIENSTVKQEGDGRTAAELFLKVFKLSKQLLFQMAIQTKAGSQHTVLQGQSVIFGTHNSGKQRFGSFHTFFFSFFFFASSRSVGWFCGHHRPPPVLLVH